MRKRNAKTLYIEEDRKKLGAYINNGKKIQKDSSFLRL